MQELEHSLGARLRALRKGKKMTLKEVGQEIGLTATAISCYENDSRNPSPTVLNKLARLYETTTDDILGMPTEEKQTSLEAILTNPKLTWAGMPLRDDELQFIKQFLEMRVKDKKEIEKHLHMNDIG